MNNIEWQEGAVCFAGGLQFGAPNGELYPALSGGGAYINYFNRDDFQLNEPRIGDYLPKSELDTEQKYNNAVDELGLFGFNPYLNYDLTKSSFCKHGYNKSCGLIIRGDNIELVYNEKYDLENSKRKLTYPQLMAIGKLKRLMNERKSVEKTNSEIKQAVKNKINSELDKPKTAKQYLNECIDVQNQRGEQYDSKGTGERSFDAAAKAYNALTGQKLKGSDVCLLLTCVKAVRQYSNPDRLHEDSLLDGVSYLSLWAEELNKELK